MNLSDPLEQAIHITYERLSRISAPWLIGGSSGLLLHKLPIPVSPRDLDVYVDRADFDLFHESLSDFATDTPIYSTTERYASTLSHYQIAGMTLEMVGGFCVRVTGATYQTLVAEILHSYSSLVNVAGISIRLTPLAHELIFNLLRERSDRYELIAEAMREQPHKHTKCLKFLIANNAMDESWIHRIAKLLQLSATDLFPSGGASSCQK